MSGIIGGDQSRIMDKVDGFSEITKELLWSSAIWGKSVDLPFAECGG